MRNDFFYIGYLPKAPPDLARFRARVATGIVVAVPIIAALAAFAQHPLPEGVFEFGIQREFEGVLYETPLPLLHLASPLEIDGGPRFQNLLLKGVLKNGLPEYAKGRGGNRVRFKGTLIHKDNIAMIEMNDAQSFNVIGPADSSLDEAHDLGPITLSGELVDTNCYLGVMRPGVGKVHRGCAVRCLSGGIPPGLLVRGVDSATAFMLTGADGTPLAYDVAWAARTVTVSGGLRVHDELPVIYVSKIELYSERE